LAGGDCADRVSEPAAEQVDAQLSLFGAVDAFKANLEQDLRVCGGTSTLSRLTTFPPVEAIFSARAELLRFLTVPRRKMMPLSR